jgi:hypothetical protein
MWKATSNTHNTSQQNEQPKEVGRHKCGSQHGSYPYAQATDHQNFPVVAVAEKAANWGEDHEEDNKDGLKETGHGVVDVEVLLDVGENT